MPYYAHANLEVPQWGEMLGIDPRTKQEVWDPVLDDQGRQVQKTYMRGDEVTQGDFRAADWDNYIQYGAIAEGAPEPDVSAPTIVAGVEAAPAPPAATADQSGVAQ